MKDTERPTRRDRRPRRRFAQALPLLLPAVLGGVLLHCKKADLNDTDPPQPNVVLILVDDQGWSGTSVTMDDRVPLSKSDFYRTPQLERLAREGMRFSQAYAPHPMCIATRASIQTGKSPAQLGMMAIRAPRRQPPANLTRLIGVPKIVALSNDEITIAEFIRAAAPEYATAHVGKWHLRGGGPGRNGYQEFGPVRGEEEQPNPRQAFSITGFANRFMEARVKAAQPFFLQISYRAIHIGVRARPATTEKYLNAPSGRRHRNALYAALTEDLDTDLGLLLDKIDDLGIADSTYVVYTSDNGADAGPLSSHITSNAPLSGFKTTLLEGGIRVPFVVRGPGIAGGIVSHVPVIGYDLFPTIRDWLGLEEPLSRGVEGGSLKRLAENRGRGQIERPRDELVWHYPYYRTGCLPPQSAIRLGDLKLIHNWESDQVQLFDLSRDLGETQDLASTMRDQAIALGQRLRDYLTAVGAPMPQTNPDYDPHRDPTRECQRTDSQSRSAARAWSNPA